MELTNRLVGPNELTTKPPSKEGQREVSNHIESIRHGVPNRLHELVQGPITEKNHCTIQNRPGLPNQKGNAVAPFKSQAFPFPERFPDRIQNLRSSIADKVSDSVRTALTHNAMYYAGRIHNILWRKSGTKPPGIFRTLAYGFISPLSIPLAFFVSRNKNGPKR